MNDADVLAIALQAIIVAGKLCAPILLVTLAVGFGISLLQAVTQIQEVTLTFVPKLIVVGLCLAIFGSAILMLLVDFTHELFARIPELTR